jgi:hypothetical protein
VPWAVGIDTYVSFWVLGNPGGMAAEAPIIICLQAAGRVRAPTTNKFLSGPERAKPHEHSVLSTQVRFCLANLPAPPATNTRKFELLRYNLTQGFICSNIRLSQT